VRYLSVCSGIEAATVAWHPLGWEPVAFAEVEPFPSAVLAHHYPNVPNWGDMTKFKEWPDAAIDVLVGGTPCQSFSVAGKRGGMDDPRGQLAYAFAGIAARYKPEWIVWENVPGVLSSAGGRDFAGFVRGLAELGYQCAWRVLDAQYFGVPQRRRRVFLIGNSGGWQRAAAVLFERESMLGNPPPSRKTRQVAPTIPARSTGGGGLGTDFDCDGGVIQAFGGNNQAGPIDVATARNACASASGRMDFESETFLVQPVAHSLRGEGFDASEDGTGRGTPLVPVAYSIMPMNSGKDYKARETDVAQPLMAGGPVGGNQGGDFIAQPVHAFDARQSDVIQYGDMTGPLDTDGHSVAVAVHCRDVAGTITSNYGKQVDNSDTALGPNVVAVAISESGGIASTLRTGGNDHADSYNCVAVGFAQNQRDEVRTMQVAGALAAEPGAKQQTYIAQPYTLAIRGRDGEPDLEYRQDGTANALLTPNGGRGGIGVGAIAFSGKDYGGDATADLSPTLRSMGHDGSHANGGGQVAVAFDTTQITSPANYSNPKPGDPCHPLASGAHAPAVAYKKQCAHCQAFFAQYRCAAESHGECDCPKCQGYCKCNEPEAKAICIKGAAIGRKPEAGPQYGETLTEASYTLNCVDQHGVMTPAMQVRRLTPVECERLQGFPDGYTAIPWRNKPADQCPDGPRYKALGNSMAVPCMRWIGERIAKVTK
jgi:DNA (cytosine-5)-methyltransferase 1